MIAKKQDWDASFAYAPPLVDVYIPNDKIVEIKTSDVPSRTTVLHWCAVTLITGDVVYVAGKFEDLVKQLGVEQ